MARAVVIGAGVGGLAAGVALQQRGWSVSVLERAPGLEAIGAGLALAPNALRALDVLGLGAAVRARSALQGAAGIVRTDGRWISRTSTDVAEARYGDRTVILHRAELVDLLAGALKPGTLHLGAEVTEVDAESGTVRTVLGDTKADLVVAADGIDSPVRHRLFPAHPGPVYAGVTSWRIIIPPPVRPVLPVETWGRGRVFGVAGLGDGRVYCYATAPAEPHGRAPDEKAEMMRLFGAWHAPVPQLIAAAGKVVRTDIRHLETPLPALHLGRVVLLGDAAHAMTPNLGQGGCQALEDAVVLAAYATPPLGEHGPGGLDRYTADRLPRTTAVAAASLRISRLTRLRNPATVLMRDAAMQAAGRLGPNLVLDQLDPVLGWCPPTP